MNQPGDADSLSFRPSTRAAWVAATVALLLAFGVSGADVYWQNAFNGSPAYPSVLLSCFWVRSRKFLWSLAALLVALTLVCGAIEQSDPRSWIHRGLAILAVLATALVCHYLLGTERALRRTAAELSERGGALNRANTDLAAREREIATQNEELRSQTEELERQSEELRVANDELARRERTLEALLRLSRSLTAEMSRTDTLDRICQALSEMMEGPGLGVGVKLKYGEVLHLVCHYGFGPAGPETLDFPYEQSFGRLVLERNHTGYLEDADLRPDLVMPQPKEGERFRAILAAPLRVNGHAVGTLEVYARQRRTWSDEQINMIESLAAQTSVSLQAAELFERVERARRRFETIFRTLPVGVSVIDREGEHIITNPAGTAMLSMPPEMLASQRLQALNYRVYRAGEELNTKDLSLQRALAGEEEHAQELEVAFPGGRRITLLTSAAPIRNSQGQIEGAVVVYADITELKQLQQELDSRRRVAEEASVRKSRFLAQVSHDIRNPANAIGMLAELLYRTASEPAMASEVPQIAQDLRRNALSLVDLVSDVLDLTRFDAGRIELEETEFSLADMLHDECRGYQQIAAEKGLECRVSVPQRAIIIRADRVKLSRVIGNLVSNAIKFTQQGWVRVEAQADAQGVCVRVSDSGMGIAAEFHDRIFDEFFQLRNQVSRGNGGGAADPQAHGARGAGLGLAICKRLVEAMGGNIDVQSRPGDGSTFIVTLPSSAVVAR